MIVVDSSVWISHLTNLPNAAVDRLLELPNPGEILVGDLILLEVLQGARDERHAARIERNLRQFQIRPMLDDRLAVQAARNYRALRTEGVTVRKTVDLIIATFCIDGGHVLLHNDRDFDPYGHPSRTDGVLKLGINLAPEHRLDVLRAGTHSHPVRGASHERG